MNNVVFQINDEEYIEDMSIYKDVVMKPMDKLIMSDKIYPIEDDQFEDILVNDMSDDLQEDLQYPIPIPTLNFNHPTKELIWISKINNATDSNNNEEWDNGNEEWDNGNEEWDNGNEEWDNGEWFEDDNAAPIKNEHIINIYKPVGQIPQNPKNVVSPWIQSSYEPDINVKNNAICY